MRGLLVGIVCLHVGCGFDPLDRCGPAVAGAELACPTPGVLDRAFDLFVPATWDGTTPLPLIYGFHGGGGHRSSAARLTCPDGDTDSPACLHAKANAAGYAVAFPDGTGTRPTRNIRTWNAGGGVGDWQCVSGAACASGVDDMAYLDAVHAEIQRVIPVDASRVYATGLSNGAAITHRFACERPDRLAAIAAFAGTNQHAVAGGACPGGVPVMQIHGTEDPCWTFVTSSQACAQKDGKNKLGAMPSTEAWATRNGCVATTTEQALPDVADDGTASTHIRWDGCSAAVEMVRIDGGGHTWPQGDPFSSEDRVGRVSQDFDGDDLILEFFGAHTK